MATMDGATKSIFGDRVQGAWAWSTVASWECQCEGEDGVDCEVFWGKYALCSSWNCVLFMLSKGWRR